MSEIADEPVCTPLEITVDRDFIDQLRDLPPSSKLVAMVLANEPWLTHRQIAEQSLLPERTVRYAIKQLDAVDLISTRYSLQDARKQLYALDN